MPQLEKPAPVFKGTAVINGELKEISLNDYNGKYVILIFYPLDFTFVCPTEMIAFSENYNEFSSINTELIGVSVDSEYSHLAWIAAPREDRGLGGTLNYPLLSDLKHTISKDYNVYNEETGYSWRGLFIIDAKGILRHFSVTDNSVGRSVQETLRLLKAIQYIDKVGGDVACPINWTPGSASMEANLKGYKDYFKKK